MFHYSTLHICGVSSKRYHDCCTAKKASYYRLPTGDHTGPACSQVIRHPAVHAGRKFIRRSLKHSPSLHVCSVNRTGCTPKHASTAVGTHRLIGVPLQHCDMSFSHISTPRSSAFNNQCVMAMDGAQQVRAPLLDQCMSCLFQELACSCLYDSSSAPPLEILYVEHEDMKKMGPQLLHKANERYYPAR